MNKLMKIEAVAKPSNCPVGALADGYGSGKRRLFASARAPTRRGFAIATILKNESVVAAAKMLGKALLTATLSAATNSGEDEGENSQTTSADVKPDVDTSVVPGL